jgi:hypothetical protein
MTMTPEEARFIAEHPALVRALADIEQEAIERAINCAPADDLNRRMAALEARAVRALRSRLAALGRPAAEAAKGPSPYA